jgi:hypothetical protein
MDVVNFVDFNKYNETNTTIYYRCKQFKTKKCKSTLLFNKNTCTSTISKHCDACRIYEKRKFHATQINKNFCHSDEEIDENQNAFCAISPKPNSMILYDKLFLNETQTCSNNSSELSSIKFSSSFNINRFTENEINKSNDIEKVIAHDMSLISHYSCMEVNLEQHDQNLNDEICNLFTKSFDNINKKEFLDCFELGKRIFVLKSENVIIASAIFEIIIKYEIVLIKYMVSSVKEKYFGSDLINRAKSLQKENNCTCIVVEASNNAIDFYTNNGFKKCSKTTKNYLNVLGKSIKATYMQLGTINYELFK